MTDSVRRAGAFTALSTLVLVVPVLGSLLAAPIAVLLLVGALVITRGPVFEVLALPPDRDAGRLYGVAGFVLAAILLGVLAEMTSLSTSVFVGTVLLLGYGGFAEALVRRRIDDAAIGAFAFIVGGSLAAVAGVLATIRLEGATLADWLGPVLFLAASGTLLAALLRDVLIRYDDPIVMLAVGLLLWLLEVLDPGLAPIEIGAAVAITGAFGVIAYGLGTASVAGMLTGVVLGLLTIVLGGVAWFVALIAFFAVGGLSTKFRYERKLERGVAEANEGARGTGNVLSNSAVALLAVLGYAAALDGLVPLAEDLFLLAFLGAVATALADTLSSEIGGLFDRPRLLTTLEPVEPGTDGAITWQGQLAGLSGAGIIAGIALGLFDTIDPLLAGVVVVAGLLGMTVDSLLGATVENWLLGNQGVNFLATLGGALVGVAAALAMA